MSTQGAVSNSNPLDWARGIGTRLGIALHRLFRVPRGVRPRLIGRLTVRLAIVLAVLFFSSMFFLDVPAIERARAMPHWVRVVFEFITDFGTGAAWLYPVGFILLVLALAPPALPRSVQAMIAVLMVRIGFLFIAIGLPTFFTMIVKRLIGRARPFVGGSADAFLYRPLEWNPAAYSSLPSGHATAAFAAAIAVGALFPRLRALMWVYALLIGFSRVFLWAHHPSDVLAGAVVGGVFVVLVRNYFAARRLGFGVDEQGAVHVFGGPSASRIKSVPRAMLGQVK